MRLTEIWGMARAVHKPSLEERRVAGFFLHVIEGTPPVHLVEQHGDATLAAADAFVAGDKAGIGGWWLPDRLPVAPENVHVFAYQFSLKDLPRWFKADQSCEKVGLQLLLCAFKALAQLVGTAGAEEKSWACSDSRVPGASAVRQHGVCVRFFERLLHKGAPSVCPTSRSTLLYEALSQFSCVACAWRAQPVGRCPIPRPSG